MVGTNLVDLIVCNSYYEGKLEKGTHWVKTDEKIMKEPRVYAADLLDRERTGHHDARKLAQVLTDLYNERTGPLG